MAGRRSAICCRPSGQKILMAKRLAAGVRLAADGICAWSCARTHTAAHYSPLSVELWPAVCHARDVAAEGIGRRDSARESKYGPHSQIVFGLRRAVCNRQRGEAWRGCCHNTSPLPSLHRPVPWPDMSTSNTRFYKSLSPAAEVGSSRQGTTATPVHPASLSAGPGTGRTDFVALAMSTSS
jgi:hypothetical protein